MKSFIFKWSLCLLLAIVGLTHLNASYHQLPQSQLVGEYCCCPDGDCACTESCCSHGDSQNNPINNTGVQFKLDPQCALPGEAQTAHISQSFMTLITPYFTSTYFPVIEEFVIQNSIEESFISTLFLQPPEPILTT